MGQETKLKRRVKGFIVGTGIRLTLVPGGRRFRSATWMLKFPNSQNCNCTKFLFSYNLDTRNVIKLNCNTYNESTKTNVKLNCTRRSIKWMVDKVWNKSSEAPVISTVFKEIHYWHCIVRETMYKQCFKHTLCIMEWPTVSSNSKKTKIRISLIINKLNILCIMSIAYL